MKRLAGSIILCLTPVSAILFTGCSTVPYTERSRILLTGEREENRLGSEAWRKMLSENRISADPKQNQALQRVGRNIAAVAGKPEYRWEFKVFRILLG
ncbi:MAG: hypothetical protein PHH77_07515 [Victivallaceae bacterium]|nr:hypothetical protein [Victivallaceae bacterium]